MPMASSLQPNEGRFFALFVSKSGCGKTCAAASFQNEEHNKKLREGIPTVRILDFDGRIRGLLGAPWVDRSRIEYTFYPPKTKPGDPTYVRLNNDLEVIQQACNTGTNELDTLIFDSLTSSTFAMIMDALPLTHKAGGSRDPQKGKFLGNMPMAGPEDYGFEATSTYAVMTFLRSLPIQNIIVTAHLVDRFGKEEREGGIVDPYSASVVIGEKLSLRDKISENVLIYFDHVFKFSKDISGMRHYVEFRTDIARTSYQKLPNGKTDITGKNFYKLLSEMVK